MHKFCLINIKNIRSRCARHVVFVKSYFCVLMLLLSLSSCSYMESRVHDFTDIVTLTGEIGYANAGVHVGPIITGGGYSRGRGVGLISGCFGAYRYSEISVIFLGAKEFRHDNSEVKEKGYYITSGVAGKLFQLPDGLIVIASDKWQQYFQVEGSVCVVYGIRCGFNLIELVDFITGIMPWVDLCDDDIKPRDNPSTRTRTNQ